MPPGHPHKDSPQPRRKSIRLRNYDYASSGVYFVTICTRDRRPFFHEAVIGQQATACWLAIPTHHRGVTLDEWVLMPNHLHGLIEIHEQPGRGVQLNAPTTEILDPSLTASDRVPSGPAHYFSAISPRRGTLSIIVRTYKAAVTTACRSAGSIAFAWQRGYYDHVVRNRRELDRIRRYIQLNPLRWDLDRDNLTNVRRLRPPVTINDYLADLESAADDH